MSASSNHSEGQFNGKVKQKMVPATSKNKVKSFANPKSKSTEFVSPDK